MRVITGSARGARLETPEGLDTRPTSEMVKEAIFSMLQFEIEQATVLDLFAGSGQLGVEALSRGAKLCIFVDTSREAQEIIRRNVAAAKVAPASRVAAMDARAYLSTTSDRFDIAFLDPPYTAGLLETLLPEVAARMNESGIIVCEAARDVKLPETAGSFAKFRVYKYGKKTQVTTYRLKADKEH